MPAPGLAAATTSENPAAAEMAAPTGTVAVPQFPTPAPGQTPAGETPAPGRGYQAAGPAPPAQKSGSKLPLVLAVLVVLGLAGLAYVLLTGGEDEGPRRATARPSTRRPAAGRPPTPGHGDAVIPVGARPFRIATTGDAVWVTNNEATTVSRIDPATNEVVATIDVGGQVVGVDATDEAAWVANTEANTVVRIDAATQEQLSIGVEDQPRIVAVTDSAVWVTNLGSDSVTHIVRDTNEVDANIPVADDPGAWPPPRPTSGSPATRRARSPASTPPATGSWPEIPVGGNPVSVVITDDAVWVAETATDTVIQIDPATNTEVRRIPVGVDPTAAGRHRHRRLRLYRR